MRREWVFSSDGKEYLPTQKEHMLGIKKKCTCNFQSNATLNFDKVFKNIQNNAFKQGFEVSARDLLKNFERRVRIQCKYSTRTSSDTDSCRFSIYLKLDKKKNIYYIKKCNNIHNHDLDN